MAQPSIQGAHLVGSIPLPTVEECFRVVCKALPGHVKRIPDGEPGNRNNFIAWQGSVFQREPRFVKEGRGGTKASIAEEEADDILKSLPELETGYEDHALSSYGKFQTLRDAGVIPQGVRFLVALPSPLTVVSGFIKSSLWNKVEPFYQEAMLRSLKRIVDGIPSSDLAIQWDVPLEFAMLEGTTIYGDEIVHPLAFQGVIDRLVMLGESVPEGVELGYHFCYGDVRHKHFMEPNDTLTMVNVANALLAQCKRRVEFIHMPVPLNRVDSEYFQPLKQLSLGGTELILGLVHFNDIEGTRARISAARDFVQSFAVSSECGLGRTPPEQVENILSILAEVSEPVRQSTT